MSPLLYQLSYTATRHSRMDIPQGMQFRQFRSSKTRDRRGLSEAHHAPDSAIDLRGSFVVDFTGQGIQDT